MLTYVLAQSVPGIPVDVGKFIPDGPTSLLIILLIGSVFAIVKGYVVPKPFYDREVQRGDKATEALHKNNDALEALTREVRIRRGAKDETS